MKPRLLALVLLALLVVPAVAVASRVPMCSEGKAIRAAMVAFIARPDSPAAKDNKVVKIRVSTVDSWWARADTSSPTVGRATAILHKKSEQGVWKVRAFGSGGFECGTDAPKKVLNDLLGGCVPPR